MIVMTDKLHSLMEKLKEVNAEAFYHCVRTKNLVCKMIRGLNSDGTTSYSNDELSAICKGALLHDLGKLFVDNLILTKESHLTAEEKECITRHTHLGFEAIESELNEGEYEIVKNILLYHHERSDGNGYEKLKDLPLYIHVVAVCDVYDALNSDRIYRKRFSREKTLEIIRSGGSGFFEEELIARLEKASEEI